MSEGAFTPDGKPTRLILACHGILGYIHEENKVWYNQDWMNLMQFLNDAGYAVFDANLLCAARQYERTASGMV